MWVEAAIAFDDGSFHVYINSEGSNADELNRAFREDDGVGSKLPLHIRSRARFSIAHEIAHTFFYSCSENRLKSIANTSTPRTHRSLEYSANTVAGALLLPHKLLLPLLRTRNLLDPDVLASVTQDACVSGDALIRRLSRAPDTEHPLGMLAYITTGDNPVFRAISSHYSLRPVFGNIEKGFCLRDLIRIPLPTVLDGDSHQEKNGDFLYRFSEATDGGRFLTAVQLGRSL